MQIDMGVLLRWNENVNGELNGYLKEQGRHVRMGLYMHGKVSNKRVGNAWKG